MQISVDIGYERAAIAENPDTINGDFTITNWDDQVKIEGGFLGTPVYINRAELLHALLALEAGSGG